MAIFSDFFALLIDVWKEMILAFLSVLPKVISVFLWLLTALIVLPCVFVAGQIYPKWVEWGEDF